MKSKKLLSLLLALAMVMSMAACGAKTNEPPATSGTPSETGAPATEELNWPTKEITLIQPWSLGGGPDVITRQIASYSDKILGVPMIVENHTGGSGTIGMNDFLEAEDDGYTLFCCNGPLFSLTPSFIDVDYTIDDQPHLRYPYHGVCHPQQRIQQDYQHSGAEGLRCRWPHGEICNYRRPRQ